MDGPGDGTPGPAPLTVQIAPRTIVIAVLVITAVWLLFRLTDFLMVLVFAILLALLAGALLAVPITVILWVVAEELLPNRTRTPNLALDGPSSAESNRKESTEPVPNR